MAQTRITVTLEEDQYLAISEMAEEEGRGLSDLVRDAVVAYLDEHRWTGTDNIGETAEKALKRGLTNEEVLEHVRAKFPDARTSDASIRWYRMKVRKKDSSVPTQARAKQMREERGSK